MKNIKNIRSVTGKRVSIPGLAILILALSCAFPISANAKARSYILECRGGGKIGARIFNVGNIVISGYRPARLAAGVQPPRAGECAWLDRPMKGKELRTLFYAPRKLPFRYVDVYPNRVSFRWQNGHPMAPVLKAIQTNKLFFVHVRMKRINRGRSKHWVLNIERVGP